MVEYVGRELEDRNNICAVAIIAQNNKILMGLREYSKGNPLWTFPGGRCYLGEAPESGLAREVEEETGITDLKIIRLLGEKEGTYKGGKIPDRVFIYECVTKQVPKLAEPEKFLEWKWINRSELPENLVDSNDKYFINKLFGD